MHGEWLRYAKSTSQFHWRFLLVRDVLGFQVNPLCRHDITRSDRQIGNSYEGMTCRVAHGSHFTKSFAFRTGVNIFFLAIDWILKKTTAGKRNGIQWTLGNQLKNLDFADDIALLSHNRQQMQEKTSDLSTGSAKLGLRIHEGKTTIQKIHATSTEPVKLRGKPLEEVESFTYLGSIIDKQAGTDADVNAKIGKARRAFLMM